MTDRTAPHSTANASSRDQAKYTYLDSGFVTSVVDENPETPELEHDGPPAVVVQEAQVPADQPIPVAPTVHGDYYTPPEGAPVLIGYLSENDPIVIATGVPDTDTPDVKAGERILSHPLSTAHISFGENGSLTVRNDGESAVQLNDDGTVTVENNSGSIEMEDDGTVIINNGSKGVITDIITATDSDGHITDITLVRNSSILV